MTGPEWTATNPAQVGVDLLYAWCETHQINICEEYAIPDPDTPGLYYHPERVIYLARGLPLYETLPTLAHETFHAYYEHDGHQDKATEKRIDEAVAQALIDPTEYAFWEEQYDGKAGGIAAKLGLPKWTIEAYQRHLAKTMPHSNGDHEN